MAGRKRSAVERTWQAHGLECAVLIMDMGHRCGYVRVPDDHPWKGLDYDDKVPEAEASDFEDRAVDDAGMGGVIAALAGNTDDWSRRVEGHVAVHGGITFAGKQPNEDCAEGWWFGFDCAHLDDTPEQWTLDAVAAETERMAEQIAAAGKESQ